uniref:Uncharacterized protein n=1 Tax=Entomoneis paludosa TaxID=265537 RepID=A0A7S2YP03_9STRA|mmetsp:Transcript_40436/g.84125  ORF Transcript_40436/g.84125 Transcript_40436/m.84125 type:complete len:181 (+) Transcript_40436:53-595(+)
MLLARAPQASMRISGMLHRTARNLACRLNCRLPLKRCTVLFSSSSNGGAGRKGPDEESFTLQDMPTPDMMMDGLQAFEGTWKVQWRPSSGKSIAGMAKDLRYMADQLETMEKDGIEFDFHNVPSDGSSLSYFTTDPSVAAKYSMTEVQQGSLDDFMGEGADMEAFMKEWEKQHEMDNKKT